MKKSSLLPLGLASVAGFIYLFTAAPFMLWLDSARFVAAIVTLGIANPPEPLYVLLAHPFIYLPFGSIIFRIQIFSALTASAALVFIYYLTLRILEDIVPADFFRSKKNKRTLILSATFSLLTMAFSYQFWSQAQNVENFILVTLIETIVLFLTFRSTTKKSVFINLSALALLLGLATGTNPIIVSVFPAVLWMMWKRRKYINLWKLAIWFVIGVLSIVAIHLYIPIRASADPFLNFWRATTLEGVWKASTGAGLNVYLPEIGRINGFTGSPEIFFKSAFHFIEFFFVKFMVIMTPFIVLGGIYLWKKSKYYFYSLISIVSTNFIFSGLYFSGNQESWFLLSDVVFVILAGLGFFWLNTGLLETLLPKIKLATKYSKLGVYFLILALIPLIFWWHILYRHNSVLTEDYIKNLYRPMGADKAILYGSSDIFDSISPLVYDVPGISVYNRKVVPITDNLLYILKWYRDNIAMHSNLKMPDDKGLKYDSALEYSKFVNDFFALNIATHKIFVTNPATRNNFLQAYRGQNLGPSLHIDETKFKLVPQGMLLEVVLKEASDEPILSNFDYQFRTPGAPKEKPTFLERTYQGELINVINEYAYSYQSLGDYFLNKGKAEDAFQFYQKAYELNSKNAEVISRFGNYYGSVGDHAKAIEFFEQALKIEPRNVSLLFNLAIAYENTGKTDKAISNYNKVLQLGKDNPQVVQLAQVRLNALNNATPSATLATGSATLQQQLTPPQLSNSGVYTNQAINIQFTTPKNFVLTEVKPNLVTLTNNLKQKDELAFTFYGRKISSGESLEDLTKNLPFTVDGQVLITQQVGIEGFEAVGKTYGGQSLTFLILMKREEQGVVVKIHPGDSTKSTEFNQVVQSIKPLK